MASCMSYLGLSFGILALGCAACGLGLEYWVERDDGEGNSGLWRRCRPTAGGETLCENELKDDYMAEYNAVRSMLIIGAAVLMLSIIIGCVSIVTSKLSTMAHLGIISAVGHAIAGVFMIVAFSVYLEEIYYPMGWSAESHLYAGFILCVLGWLVSWTAAALIVAGTYAMKRKQMVLNL